MLAERQRALSTVEKVGDKSQGATRKPLTQGGFGFHKGHDGPRIFLLDHDHWHLHLQSCPHPHNPKNLQPLCSRQLFAFSSQSGPQRVVCGLASSAPHWSTSDILFSRPPKTYQIRIPVCVWWGWGRRWRGPKICAVTCATGDSEALLRSTASLMAQQVKNLPAMQETQA